MTDHKNQHDGGYRQDGDRTVSRDDLAPRPRDDGRHDTDLDDDRTDQRMAAQIDADLKAAEADPQGEAQIDQGSHARAGMGKARQTDGS